MEKKARVSTLVEEVCATPGGEKIRLCIQCGTCTASCPNANRMDHAPRELIALVRADLREEVLSSNSMWFCASCYLCTVRCPRDIKPTELMHVLEVLAVRHGLSTSRTLTPIMYRIFSDFVYSIGSVPETSFLTWFFLLAKHPLRVLKIMPLALSLLRHGRLSVRARRLKPEAERQVRVILDKAESLGGLS